MRRARIAAVAVHHVDLEVAVAIRHERDARAVGRPRRQEVVDRVGAAGRRLGRTALIDERDEDVGPVVAAIRGVGDRAAIGRPHRRDVQRAVHRDAALILAVVVGDVDLFDRRGCSIVPLQPLAIAIGREGELRARDTIEIPLRLVQLVGDRVREHARVGRAARIFLRERGALTADLIEPHLHADLRAILADRANHHAVGARARASDS